MLPKPNRLKKKKDFEKIFRKGKGFKEGFLFLKALTNNLKFSRFGIVVGKEVSRKATLRNKIKRQIREIVRAKLAKLKTGIDVILIALSGIETKDFLEIEKTIDKLFKKAKLLK